MVSSRIALSNELLQDCFQKFDVDATGFITTDNLVEVLGDKFNGIATETMLDDVDTLNDGKMCWHEFVCFMKGKQLRLRGDEFIPSEAEGRQKRISFLPKRKASTDEGDTARKPISFLPMRKASTDEGDTARKPTSGILGRRDSPTFISGCGGLPRHPALNPNVRSAAPVTQAFREPPCTNSCSLM